MTCSLYSDACQPNKDDFMARVPSAWHFADFALTLVRRMAHSARLILNRGIRHRILDGHPWVFASEVDRLEGEAADGETVELRSAKGELLGSAIYNSRSQIVARRYARNLAPLDERLLSRRLDDALACRGPWKARGLARRLVWSESDELPGLVVDRYDDVLVLQSLTAAMARREEIIADLLRQKTGCRVILARNDAVVRQLEGLPLERKILCGDYEPPTRVTIAGITYSLDLWSGQKTGFYLDQARELRRSSRRTRADGASWMLHRPGRLCPQRDVSGRDLVPRVDQSAEALRLAETTAKTEKLKVEWIQANVFDLLRHYEQKRETFDLIVLDPPSFTKSKGNKAGALARLSRSAPARAPLAYRGRPSRHVFVLASRGRAGLGGTPAARGEGDRQDLAGASAPGAKFGPSDSRQRARNRVSTRLSFGEGSWSRRRSTLSRGDDGLGRRVGNGAGCA